jgi:hypothetical protein
VGIGCSVPESQAHLVRVTARAITSREGQMTHAEALTKPVSLDALRAHARRLLQ